MAASAVNPSVTNIHEIDKDVLPAEKVEEIRIENTSVELNTIDLELLAAESIRFRSRATLRLAVVILVQAISKYSYSSPQHQ